MSFRRLCLALLLGAGLAACAPLPQREPGTTQGPAGPAGPAVPAKPHYVINDPAQYPKTAEAVSGAAVMNLLRQSRTEVAGGKPEQALATLELALNIEPRNPFVWEEMATVHLARNLPEEAEHVATRSNSFARGNPWVEVVNWKTIMQARLARGDTAGAQEASDHYEALAARLAQ